MICAIWKLYYWGSEPSFIFLSPPSTSPLSQLVRLISPHAGKKQYSLELISNRPLPDVDPEQSLLLVADSVITALCSVFFAMRKSKSPLCVKYLSVNLNFFFSSPALRFGSHWSPIDNFGSKWERRVFSRLGFSAFLYKVETYCQYKWPWLH